MEIHLKWKVVMKLLNLFGKRPKERPSENVESVKEELEMYSGMRVEVTSFDGQLLFVAKLLGLHGDKAVLHPCGSSCGTFVGRIHRRLRT